MYAIIETGGFQYKIAPDEEIEVPIMKADVGEKVTLDRVLMIENDGARQFGRPTVEGMAVKAEVVAQGRYPKILVQKFKRRKNYRRLLGHRTSYTRLRILSIG
ncbi:MAG: 50S ribosomal protein L21 [Gemmatimonadetes bacterium]|nr:50S ribosomal protein L21 [Gemmatimonadota bacterium]